MVLCKMLCEDFSVTVFSLKHDIFRHTRKMGPGSRDPSPGTRGSEPIRGTRDPEPLRGPGTWDPPSGTLSETFTPLY